MWLLILRKRYNQGVLLEIRNQNAGNNLFPLSYLEFEKLLSQSGMFDRFQ
jgi:hypothetical protein